MRFLGVSVLLLGVLGGLDAQRKTRTEVCQTTLGRIERSEALHAARVENLKTRLARIDESSKRSWIIKYFNGVEANGTHERSCEELLPKDAEHHRKTRTARCQESWDRIKSLKVKHAHQVEKLKLKLAGQREASKGGWIKKYCNGVEPAQPWTTSAEMLSTNAEQTKEVQTEEVQSQEAQSEKDPTEEVQTEKVPTEEVLNEEANTGKDPVEKAQTEKINTEEAQAEEVPTEEVQTGKDPTEEAAKLTTEETPTRTEECQSELDRINKSEAVKLRRVERHKERLDWMYKTDMYGLYRKYFKGYDPTQPLTTCEKMLPRIEARSRYLVRYVRPEVPRLFRRPEELRSKESEKLSSKEAEELRLKKEKEKECEELLDKIKRIKAANAADLEKYRKRALKKVKMYKKGLVEWFFYGVEPAEPWTTCAEMIPKDPPDEYEGYEYDEDELKAYFDLDDNWKTRKYNTTK